MAQRLPKTYGVNRRWLCSTVLVLCSMLPPALNAAPPSSSLARDMAALLAEEELTGAVWATVDTGVSPAITVGATGVKHAGTGQPLTADDRVQVGSVAKTVVATGILRLVSEGRLQLDTPVSQLLPDVTFDNPWKATDPVRLRHLLDHTAGLDDARIWQVFSAQAQPDTPLANTYARRGGTLRIRSRPGTRFSYSNTGYGLLGGIIEATTGQRYERYLDAHLLRPLEMHDSTFRFVSQEGAHTDPRLAMGHLENAVPHAAAPLYLRPASQFTTTAQDMGKFARFLMSDGRLGSEIFIDSALLQPMGQPAGTEAAQAGLTMGYGLGLQTRDRHGAIGRCHGGSTIGYRAMFCLFPDQRRAFFLAVNTDSETADYDALDRRLVTALEITAPAPLPATPATVEVADWEGFYVPAPNRFAMVAWVDTTLNFVQLKHDGSAVQLKPAFSPEVALTPVGSALFRAPDRITASHVLITTANGTRAFSTGFRTYERIPTAKLAWLWLSLALGASGLCYLLIAGVVRLLMRRLRVSRPVFFPSLGALALLLPLPLFFRQSFLQFGDLTLASGLLAATTVALPLTMVIGLALHLRRRPAGRIAFIDAVAMLAVLQWTLVLAAWGLLPLRLWA
ncbi:serine hydrolase domain-containing protein [Pseudoxanthomonas sp. UTMC 1351]|uniref:serine hydrolase domain-containing protein n=1 Tax=Pseudoxanthomonas sp. UTMC 1351 TaxID=2695853 RepID=UPI0034CD4690